MKLSSLEYFLIFSGAFIIVSSFTPFMKMIAIKYRVVDLPDEVHKTHKSPIPYLGGVAIVFGISFVSLFASFISRTPTSTFLIAISVIFPSLILAVVGLIDDIKKLTPWSRFIVQNLVAFLSTSILIYTNTVGSPTGSTYLDIVISMFWIVGVTNAINFFDNLDGGASTTLLVSSTFLSALTFFSGQYMLTALSLTISGALCGFFIWNRPPARIYMGDSGALFLGMLMATLTLRFETLPIHKFAGFTVPVMLLAVPIIDTSVAVTSRLIRGLSPFKGGRDHLSHRLISSGLTKKQTVAVIALLTCYFSSLALIISYASFSLELYISFLGWISMLVIFVFFQNLKPIT